MPFVKANGLDICYETFGAAANPAVLLIMGLGAQLLEWEDEFCQLLADEGLFIVRFDNRDVGLTTKTAGSAPDLIPPSADNPFPVLAGSAAYTLSDMAMDGVALLDALGIDRANIVGASLGGMIAQRLTIEHPTRVRSLTSIMSTPGYHSRDASDPPPPPVDALPPNPDRETYLNFFVETRRRATGPHFDEASVRANLAQQYDRAYYPQGIAFQLAAAAADGDRTHLLSRVTCPSLVIHGRLDPLAPLSGGEATARAIPGATLLVFDEMGHELPAPLWKDIVAAIREVVSRAA